MLYKNTLITYEHCILNKRFTTWLMVYISSNPFDFHPLMKLQTAKVNSIMYFCTRCSRKDYTPPFTDELIYATAARRTALKVTWQGEVKTTQVYCVSNAVLLMLINSFNYARYHKSISIKYFTSIFYSARGWFLVCD